MGSSTNTPIVIAIFSFQLFIFILLGLIGGSFQASQSVVQPSNPGILSFLFDAFTYFVHGLTFSISNIPSVLTALLFLPTAIGLFYILVSLARGSS